MFEIAVKLYRGNLKKIAGAKKKFLLKKLM